MTAQGSKKQSAIEAELEARQALEQSGSRGRSAISAREARDPEPVLAPLTKLVSRIPPAPRIPRVEGVSMFAAGAAPDATNEDAAGAGHVSGTQSAPRWRKRQLARETDATQAWGAIIAAVLLGAFIAWASAH